MRKLFCITLMTLVAYLFLGREESPTPMINRAPQSVSGTESDPASAPFAPEANTVTNDSPTAISPDPEAKTLDDFYNESAADLTEVEEYNSGDNGKIVIERSEKQEQRDREEREAQEMEQI